MILLFLGSWRSTLIITVSIPLAILAALTGLSLLGETINVMTLGGLALAVGILVDDATVTIENINWHLEQGKEIEPAILDGARQIVVPATVSLLCICIAFVPMFGLGGVAGYLFRPLAEAVMFALVASYVLSRTLVPTLANYLLRNQQVQHSIDSADHAPAKPSRNPLLRFQRGFERHFERVRSTYLGLLQLCLRNRIKLIAGFLGFSLLSFGLAPYLGQDFFPTVDGGQIKLHMRAHDRNADRRDDQLSPTGSERRSTGIIPASELDGIVSNIGLSVSGINMAYNNSGTIGVDDADILISLKPNHAPTDRLHQDHAGKTAAAVSRHDFRLPAGRHCQPDPELRRAGADRPAGCRQRPRGGPEICQCAIGEGQEDPRDRRCADPAGIPAADARTSMSTARWRRWSV